MSEYMNMGDIVTDKTKSKVCSRIINAAEKEKRYCGYSWQITGALKNGEKKRG
jgi:predicted SPOUT superfamily RNA methylase MTH1